MDDSIQVDDVSPGTEGEDEDDEEDEDDDDNDSSQEDDEEEEVEPKLKYERIGDDLTAILSKDAASCMAVHSKFLALGTHWGMIHILDHAGNNIRSKEVPAHTTTVNQISIDANGDYLASCSDDGKVVITGLYSTENNQITNFDRPVKVVGLDPHFFNPGSGKYVTGDDKLVLNEKGFLSRHKTTVLHQGEGPIRSVKWQSHFIAWSNDMGVKVFDMSTRSRITYIAKDHKYRPDMYRCNLCWKDDTTLLVGWADSVKVCMVKERASNDARDLPSRYVEITAMFTTDCFICGIAPLGTNLVILAYEKEELHQEEGRLLGNRPHLQILEPHMDYSEEFSNDALSIRGFQEYRCNDYHLETITAENLFYIISPKDIVVSKLRDHDDHINWLVEHQMFEEAMSAATTHSKELKKHTFQDIGRQYLSSLLDESSFDKAARLCLMILGKNKELWEEEVYKFANIKQLKAMAPYLPRGEPRLSPAIYEMVLNEFLQTDYEGFYKLVKEWPCELYNIQTIVNAVLDRLDHDRNHRTLLQCLGELHTFEKRFDKALAIFLRLQHKDVFKLIHKHDLFDSISDKIVQLMQFDREQAVQMLLDNVSKIPVEKVVKQLEKTPELLHIYLDKLFHKDSHLGQEFHDRQVKLYAEYEPSRLLYFLRSSSYYPLQMALRECEVRDLLKEQVYLLGRMGQTKQALQLITNRLKEVDQAIEFCKEHNDEELWEDLIMYSIDKPNFVTGLLQNIGTHVDPIILIQRIREGMEIPGLRDSLVKILQDYNLQMSLREGCRKILVADSFGLMDKKLKIQKKGLAVSSYQTCPVCQQRLLTNDLRYTGELVVFFCRHTFHEDCLPAHAVDSCTICSGQRRGPGSRAIFRK